MGSKTPEHEQRGPNGSGSSLSIADINPAKSANASGLVHGALDEGADEDGDDGDGDAIGGGDLTSEKADKKKKSRKRSKKKKKKAPAGGQTVPPTIALSVLQGDKPYDPGQIVDYSTQYGHDHDLQRTTAAEERHLAALRNMDASFLEDYRQAAEIHRQVRQHVRRIARPGVSLRYLADEIEAGVRALSGHDGLTPGDGLAAGLAFPTGLCLNHVAAHWTPHPSDSGDVIFEQDDVLKIDFGVHVNGRIVDSAFTLAPNPVYEPLLAAVRATTETGLAMAGIDARISEMSVAMQEVMESHEVMLNGRTLPVRAVRNLTGHNILRYRIHGEKQVPFVKTSTAQKMEEGDIFAIETFGSTGRAYLRDGPGVYGYGLDTDLASDPRRMYLGQHVPHASKANALLKTIQEHFGTLVFSQRYLERLGVTKYHLAMRSLVDSGVVECYKPLVDVAGSYVAQFEHTVLIRPTCKEVISRGVDY